MIGLEEKIARTRRLLRRLEEDRAYLRVRLSPLADEYRRSAQNFAEKVRAAAEAELERLIAARGTEFDCIAPQPAD